MERWDRENWLTRSSTLSSYSIFILHAPLDDTPQPYRKSLPLSSVLEPNHVDSNSIHSSVSEDPLSITSTRKRGNLPAGGTEKRRKIAMQISERVPEDLLTPIFEKLQDQRDLYACSLVSRTFNRVVTPILYRSWDTRVVVDLPASDRFVRFHKVFRLSSFSWFRRNSHSDFPDLRPGSNILGNTRTAAICKARSSHRWATFPP